MCREDSEKWIQRRAGKLKFLEAPALARLKWLVHGFSTRPGGASELSTSRDGKKATEKVLNLASRIGIRANM